MAKGDASEANRKGEDKRGERSESTEADVPVWVWTLSGLASLGIVIGIVAIVVRKKRGRPW